MKADPAILKAMKDSDLDEARRAAFESLRALEMEIKRRKLEGSREEIAKLAPLAVRAHALLCRWNHTDGCGWGYEGEGAKEWGATDERWLTLFERNYSAHVRWLDWVRDLAQTLPTTAIDEALIHLERLTPEQRHGVRMLLARQS